MQVNLNYNYPKVLQNFLGSTFDKFHYESKWHHSISLDHLSRCQNSCFDNGLVEHFAEPAMKRCLYGSLCNFGIKYKKGKSASSSRILIP